MSDVVKMKEEKKGWEIDFDTVLKDFRGKPIVQGEEPFTLADACLLALDTAAPGSEKEGLKPKLARDKIMRKIMDRLEGQKLVLPTEDVALIKTRIGDAISSSFVVGQICRLLDPATSEKE